MPIKSQHEKKNKALFKKSACWFSSSTVQLLWRCVYAYIYVYVCIVLNNKNVYCKTIKYKIN